MTSEPVFRNGDVVRRKTAPATVGVVRDAYWQEATSEWICRVQFGSSTRGVAASDLELLPEEVDPWEDVRQGRFGGHRSFLKLMTYERLRKPPSRIAGSFGAAKAAFYPHQFIPLLKFLEHPRQRLLIADEVGLGKTVEAGYIIRELRVRHELERSLVVAPSRLCRKWQSELSRRFAERYEIVAARDVVGLGERLKSRGQLGSFQWIISLESARRPDVIEVFEELQPALDIVVVDEAHRMRNPSTAQHALGKALSTCADSMVLLTATPVQTSIENLFRLLNILDQSEFQDAEVFEAQDAANRPVIQAASAIRANPPDSDTAVERLTSLERNRYTAPLVETRYFDSVLERARRAASLGRDELVALQRDINELSLTGKIITRTRKAEVMRERSLRRAWVVSVEFTPLERAFYDSVAELCRLVRPDLHGWGAAMAAMQAFRATASCIPAAAANFVRKIENGEDLVKAVLEEFEEEELRDGAAPSKAAKWRAVFQKQLESTDAPHQVLEEHDSKYALFLDALKRCWKEDDDASVPRRKTVIFSFFKPTLAYLDRRLRSDGITCQLISGDIKMEDRELRIESFATDDEVPVLLSSEVGSEGLDLQFASVIVNYDLPWNPMVVEQRIGRLDRIGQVSPSIQIMNLVAKNTIEERILLRLYDRIGVFKDSIGALDPILGESVDKLAGEALRSDLSPDEQERRAVESADAILDQHQRAQSLVASSATLMAADQAFLDEIESLIGRRRVPLAAELHQFVSAFLEERYAGSVIPTASIDRVASIRLPGGVGEEIRRALGGEPEILRFSRQIDGGPVAATFDQDAALKHARAELIHARHPLIRFASSRIEQARSTLCRSFALRLPRQNALEVGVESIGDFAFGIYSFEIRSERPRAEIVSIFIDEEGEPISNETGERLLIAMLDHAETIDPAPSLDQDIVNELADIVQRTCIERSAGAKSGEAELSEVRRDRQLTTLGAALNHKVEEAQKRLAKLQRNEAAPFAIRMAREKLAKAERTKEVQLSALREVGAVSVETECLAVGVLQVS
jgi:SNF2 family DNA or RNA helicase